MHTRVWRRKVLTYEVRERGKVARLMKAARAHRPVLKGIYAHTQVLRQAETHARCVERGEGDLLSRCRPRTRASCTGEARQRCARMRALLSEKEHTKG